MQAPVARPVSLVLAAALHLVIGLSGMAVGASLLSAAADSGLASVGISPNDAIALRAIVVGILLYGALEVVAAIGIWRRAVWGWTMALVVDLAGLVVLGWTLAIAGIGDPVLLSGIAIWSIAVALLVVRPTRAALRR